MGIQLELKDSVRSIENVFIEGNNWIVNEEYCELTIDIFREASQLSRLQWELNGIVKGSTTGTSLSLTVDRPSLSDAGEYFCVAIFKNGISSRTSAGFLLIYCKNCIMCSRVMHWWHVLFSSIAPALVEVPEVHEAVAGGNVTLNCSSNIPGTRVRWRRDPVSPFISKDLLEEVTSSQSGTYECVVIETASGGNEIYTVTSRLHVIGMMHVLHTENSASSQWSMYVNV